MGGTRTRIPCVWASNKCSNAGTHSLSKGTHAKLHAIKRHSTTHISSVSCATPKHANSQREMDVFEEGSHHRGYIRTHVDKTSQRTETATTETSQVERTLEPLHQGDRTNSASRLVPADVKYQKNDLEHPRIEESVHNSASKAREMSL